MRKLRRPLPITFRRALQTQSKTPQLDSLYPNEQGNCSFQVTSAERAGERNPANRARGRALRRIGLSGEFGHRANQVIGRTRQSGKLGYDVRFHPPQQLLEAAQLAHRITQRR